MLLRYSTDAEERLILVNLGPRTTLRMNDPLLAPAHKACRWAMSWCSERAVYGGAGVASLDVGRAVDPAGELRVAVPR